MNIEDLAGKYRLPVTTVQDLLRQIGICPLSPKHSLSKEDAACSDHLLQQNSGKRDSAYSAVRQIQRDEKKTKIAKPQKVKVSPAISESERQTKRFLEKHFGPDHGEFSRVDLLKAIVEDSISGADHATLNHDISDSQSVKKMPNGDLRIDCKGIPLEEACETVFTCLQAQLSKPTQGALYVHHGYGSSGKGGTIKVILFDKLMRYQEAHSTVELVEKNAGFTIIIPRMPCTPFPPEIWNDIATILGEWTQGDHK